MKEQVVLVDFENVQKLDLARLPAHARIKIFVGSRRALPAHVQDRDHDHFVADDLKGNREGKPACEHAPGHSRRFSSANTSPAVRPRLPSAANVARRRLISAICQSGSGSASARGARLAQISSIRSSRSDTLRPASSVAFGMDATCATLHLRIAPRKECPADDSDSTANCATSRESVAIRPIHA